MARHFDYATVNEAYLGTLRDLYENPEFNVFPRGQATWEVTDYSFSVAQPSDLPIVTACPERNKVIERYTLGEFRLYALGERRASEFAKLAPFWASMADEDGNVGSAYGYKIWYDKNTREGLTQWEWCAETLARDPDSRQAVMFFGTPASQYFANRDQACTLHGQFLLREGQLRLSMVMRSNDVVRGLVYDMPWFCHLQLLMARRLEVEPGPYHHFAHSMHLYYSTLERAGRMLG